MSAVNSSPPMRAMMSDSRRDSRNASAADFRARSPSAWPQMSLIFFSPSKSPYTRKKPSLDRRRYRICCSAMTMKPRRLRSFVRSSSTDICSTRARASLSLRSVTLCAAISRDISAFRLRMLLMDKRSLLIPEKRNLKKSNAFAMGISASMRMYPHAFVSIPMRLATNERPRGGNHDPGPTVHDEVSASAS